MEYLSIAVHALTAAEGGRSVPFSGRITHGSCYKPHLRVGPEGEYLGIAFVDGPEKIYPGDDAIATVALMYVETGVDYSPLVVGATADMLEGWKVVARVRVLKRWEDATEWWAR